MLSSILRIRFLQILRGIREMGWIAFLLFAIMGYAAFFMFIQLGASPTNYMIVSAFLLMMLSMQIYRKDKRFLNQLSNQPNLIPFAEYSVLSIPLLVALIYYQYWLLFLLIPIALYGISLVNYTPKSVTSNYSILQYLPDDAFEWKAVIRKNFYVFALLLGGGFLASFLVGSVPIALFFIGTFFFGMYHESEPISFLVAKELPPKAFLWHKIKQGQLIFSALSFPLITAFIVFHTHLWYIPIIEYVLFSVLIHYALVVKYTFYRPNETLTSSQLFLSFGIMSCFIPFMLPVMIILGIRFYFKSINNLNFYLHDFH